MNSEKRIESKDPSWLIYKNNEKPPEWVEQKQIRGMIYSKFDYMNAIFILTRQRGQISTELNEGTSSSSVQRGVIRIGRWTSHKID